MNEQILTHRPLPGARLNMSHPLTRGLVGCWLLNENGGYRAMDLSPYGNHGTLVGFASPPPRPFNGLPFDGVGTYVNCGSDIRIYPAQFTWEFWLYPYHVGTTENSFLGSTIAAKPQHARIDSISLSLTFYHKKTDGSSAALNISDLKPSIYSFSQIIFTGDGATIRAYLNTKVSTTTTTYDGTIETVGREPRHIGRDRLLFWDGRIILVRLWNIAQKQSDIRWLYAEPYDMFLR